MKRREKGEKEVNDLISRIRAHFIGVDRRRWGVFFNKTGANRPLMFGRGDLRIGVKDDLVRAVRVNCCGAREITHFNRTDWNPLNTLASVAQLLGTGKESFSVAFCTVARYATLQPDGQALDLRAELFRDFIHGMNDLAISHTPKGFDRSYAQERTLHFGDVVVTGQLRQNPNSSRMLQPFVWTFDKYDVQAMYQKLSKPRAVDVVSDWV